MASAGAERVNYEDSNITLKLVKLVSDQLGQFQVITQFVSVASCLEEPPNDWKVVGFRLTSA